MKVVAGLIEKTEVIDEYTIDIHTPNPDPILVNQLEIFYIMDKEWAEANGARSRPPTSRAATRATLPT